MNTRLYEAHGITAGRMVSSDEAVQLRDVQLVRQAEREARRRKGRSAR